MASDEYSVLIGFYNHIPQGLTTEEYEERYEQVWRPMLMTLYRKPGVCAVLHYSGTVLKWLEKNHGEYLAVLDELHKRKQIEILGGYFYSPLLPLLSQSDRTGQAELLTTFLRKKFGKKPRGCWLPEYSWDPGLASSLKSSGFDYCFLTDRLFVQSSNVQNYTGDPAITEDQGKSIIVFPACDIEELFGHAVPVMVAIKKLASLRKMQKHFSVFYHGEALAEMRKAEPFDTPEKMFEKIFENIEGNPKVRTTTIAEIAKNIGALNIAYFPASGSHRMLLASTVKEQPIPLNKKIAWLWNKNALTSWVTVNSRNVRSLLENKTSLWFYSRMQFVKSQASLFRGDKSRKKTALEELWKAQSNDYYWRGPFGGMNRPSIRAAGYAALIEAERVMRPKSNFKPRLLEHDIDLDGLKEFLFQGLEYNAFIHIRGGHIIELDSLRDNINLIDCAHKSGSENICRSFADKIFSTGSYSDCLADFSDKLFHQEASSSFKDGILELTAEQNISAMGVTAPIIFLKKYQFDSDCFTLHYTFRNSSTSKAAFRFGTSIYLCQNSLVDKLTCFGQSGTFEVEPGGNNCEGIAETGIFAGYNQKGGGLRLESNEPIHYRYELARQGKTAMDSQAIQFGLMLTIGWEIALEGSASEQRLVKVHFKR